MNTNDEPEQSRPDTLRAVERDDKGLGGGENRREGVHIRTSGRSLR